MSTESKLLGSEGEDLACDYLLGKGLKIVERNWRCQAGEADIIAFDNDELAFIEVKTRRGVNAGFPEEAVTRAKRQRYERIALSYLADHRIPTTQVRFDVIAVIVVEPNRAFLRHHYDAFGCGD
ncbi:MAG: YraN family protein [Coriobacteriales bacterium]|nr:YraN family protein [Coriobacteriales bacterium]